MPINLVRLDLFSFHEQLHAGCTNHTHFFGASDSCPTFWANPFASAALCFGWPWCSCFAASGCFAAVSGAYHVCPCKSLTHLNVFPAHKNDEAEQLFGRAGNRPSIFWMVVYKQAVRLCLYFKVLVVINSVCGGVFDAAL